MKKIYLSILLCCSGCKPQVAPTEDQSEFASVAGDVSGITLSILKLLKKGHSAEDVARVVAQGMKAGPTANNSADLLENLAKGIIKSKRFFGLFGNDFAVHQRLLFAGLKVPIARTASKMYKIHGWEDEAARTAVFAQDATRGIVRGGYYIAPVLNNAKRLESVSTVAQDGKLYLSVNDLASNTVWSAEELVRLIKSGAFKIQPSASNEIIYAATKDKDGIVSIAVGVSETARGAIVKGGDSLVLAGRKINHPQLVAFLNGGKVKAEDVAVYASGQVSLGQNVVAMGNWWEKLNPFHSKKLFVAVEHFNTGSGHIMRGATDFTPSFLNRVLDLMGCNATRVVPGIN